jgi:hypothetical protein
MNVASARRGEGDEIEEDEGTLLITALYRLKVPPLASKGDKAAATASRLLQQTQSSAMHHSHKSSSHVLAAQCHASSKLAAGVSTVTFCPSKRRLYVGMESGEMS